MGPSTRSVIGALLLAACAVLTAQRLPVWRSDDSLWLDAHRRSPTLPRPLINLGAAALQRGEAGKAVTWFDSAEQTGRLSPYERQALRRLRCVIAVRYDGPASYLEGCA